MFEQGEGPREGTAQWLVELIQRKWPESNGPGRASESSEELLQIVEERAGRSLRSRKAIDKYFDEPTERSRQRTRSESRRQLIRDSVLVGVLAVSILQYYFLDVSLKIQKLESVPVYVPVNSLAHNKIHT
jgi:hypothetical protein